MKTNIVKIAVLIIAVLSAIILYQTYLQIFKSSYLFNHPRNRRTQEMEELITRGRIVDSSGRVLAETVVTGGVKQRKYPYGEITANITGYLSPKYGRWGLESTYNKTLLGLQDSYTGDDFWALKKFAPQKQGNDVILSLQADLQQVVYLMLGNRKGAAVAIEPSTGRILALVSKPGFNPEHIDENWSTLRTDPDSPMLNRAAQGLYPPGSVISTEMARRFGLTKNIPFDLPVTNGKVPDPDRLSKLELGESAIGQGRVLVTPLQMALVAAAVANKGRVMTPTLVDKIQGSEGFTVQSGQSRLLWTVVPENVSDTLRELMVFAVASGTGKEASVPGIRVAGKTGSAENPHGPPHAWFIGFAPADKPEVAVAVIIENGGAGGREAAPVAREIMKTVIERKR